MIKLPRTIISNILTLLDSSTLYKCMITSNRLTKFCENDNFWKTLTLKENKTLSLTWKGFYKNKFQPYYLVMHYRGDYLMDTKIYDYLTSSYNYIWDNFINDKPSKVISKMTAFYKKGFDKSGCKAGMLKVLRDMLQNEQYTDKSNFKNLLDKLSSLPIGKRFMYGLEKYVIDELTIYHGTDTNYDDWHTMNYDFLDSYRIYKKYIDHCD